MDILSYLYIYYIYIYIILYIIYVNHILPQLFYMYLEGLAGLKVPMLAISGPLLSSSKTTVGATPHGSPHVQVLGGLAVAMGTPGDGSKPVEKHEKFTSK
jgi:hypothetical protein